MRVALITNTVDKSGGLERYVSELAAALAHRGANVTLVGKRLDPTFSRGELRPDGVRVIRTSVPSKDDPTFALRYPFVTAFGALRAVHGLPPDTVLHGHFAVPVLPFALVRRRYVYTFHAPVYRELLSERQGSYALPPVVQGTAVAGLRGAERLVVSSASAITVLSEFMRRELSVLSPRAGDGALLLPGGVDTRRFSPGPAERPAWAREADPLLFTARRLAPRTGVAELIEAMPEILAARPRALLAVAGTGGEEGRARSAIARLGLEARVVLLGRISDEELVRCYRVADLVVMPTQELEGFGLSTAEALACGTPVVGTPVGATPEILAPLDPRLVTADRTPAGIARGITDALADPDLLQRVRREARARVDPAMSWPTIAERFLELYARLPASRQ